MIVKYNIPLGALDINGIWIASLMFSNILIILIICNVSCYLYFYKNFFMSETTRDQTTVSVFINTLKRVQPCQRKVRATLSDACTDWLLLRT